MKNQSIKRTTDWKGLSQKLTEIEQEFEQKDKHLQASHVAAYSNDFRNFSWTTYKNSDKIDSDHMDREEEKLLQKGRSGFKTINKVKFYKNSKFKSNDFSESYENIDQNKRRRLMTFEEQNYSMLNPATKKAKETKVTRENSIYGGDVITLRK